LKIKVILRWRTPGKPLFSTACPVFIQDLILKSCLEDDVGWGAGSLKPVWPAASSRLPAMKNHEVKDVLPSRWKPSRSSAASPTTP